MKKMRVELSKSREAAAAQADVLRGLGYSVTALESCEIVWVNDPDQGALVTYSDPADNEVWVVIGKK